MVSFHGLGCHRFSDPTIVLMMGNLRTVPLATCACRRGPVRYIVKGQCLPGPVLPLQLLRSRISILFCFFLQDTTTWNFPWYAGGSHQISINPWTHKSKLTYIFIYIYLHVHIHIDMHIQVHIQRQIVNYCILLSYIQQCKCVEQFTLDIWGSNDYCRGNYDYNNIISIRYHANSAQYY